MEIQDRITVVTGGASGIGAAMCRRFAAEGARTVVVADLNGDAASFVAAEIGGVALELDVSDEPAVKDVVDHIEDTYGPIDLFCHNAGIATGGGVDATTESWQRAWEVNFMSHVYATRAVLPGMLGRGDGYLLHTASAAGLLTNIGAAPYSVTKHAVVALAEWLSMTHGDAGIKVSCLCPQFVTTPLLEEFAAIPGGAALIGDGAITAEEVAAAVVEGLRQETFLILPHPDVLDYFQRKATDYDRWLSGMRRLQAAVTAAGA